MRVPDSQRGRQILPFERRGAQIHHGTPRLGEAVARHLARQVQIAGAPASASSGMHIATASSCDEIPTKPCASVS